MNISCLQENISSALSLVRAGIGKETGLPILSTILIRAEGKFIYLNTTNLEVAIQCNVRGKVEEDGSIALPAKTFIDLISLLPKEKIDLKKSDTTMEITCGSYHTKIHGMAPDEFPLISTPKGENILECSQKDLKNALAAVGHAASQQETRPELNGVLFQWVQEKNHCVCVGTDAYRLAETYIKARGGAPDFSCIIPIKTVHELSHTLLSDNDIGCEVCITDTQLSIKTDIVECVSKIVQGAFPDYHSIIPQHILTRAVLDRDELSRAVKATSLFSRGGLHDVVCHLVPTDETRGTVTLSSSNASVGENTVTLDAEMTGGENVITLNYRYLLDGLGHIESDVVSFGVVDTQSPCVLRPTGKGELTYLIMPIRE